MRDLVKWNIALARLSNFIEKFPSCPDEDHIFQYHECIGLFWHSLCRWEIIEYAYFSRQIGGLIAYATNKYTKIRHQSCQGPLQMLIRLEFRP